MLHSAYNIYIAMKVGESRQPWTIFQFPLFFGQVDNKDSKNK